MIVKENFLPDSTFAAVTTMYRVAGCNPDHQDWFFAKHDPAGVAETAGRDPMCQACHASAPGEITCIPSCPSRHRLRLEHTVPRT